MLLISLSIWLECDHRTRWPRRVHFKYPEYEQVVLKPMHEKYVVPSRQYAEHIVDVGGMSGEEVVGEVEKILRKHLGKKCLCRSIRFIFNAFDSVGEI